MSTPFQVLPRGRGVLLASNIEVSSRRAFQNLKIAFISRIDTSKLSAATDYGSLLDCFFVPTSSLSTMHQFDLFSKSNCILFLQPKASNCMAIVLE
ncbi:hypothetical protein E6O75_ATG10411 [Venturia nashicola]|uniref:Uncharacterized protein n=1 Tax=Venturia nashicola TaxID=86259 RepID=A0A4Z1NNZ5_9PEZI|nr:hypothetical protein E6O75_ATG10411 [Venturia nashicola]